MDFPQVLIPVVVIAPLIAFIVFTIRRRPAPVPATSIFEPVVDTRSVKPEIPSSRSTIVTREITLSAKYEKILKHVLTNVGRKTALTQLPTLPPFFTGRRSELARALTLLDVAKPARAIAITAARGAAGMGRTAFASALAHLLMERYSDAQLFLDLREEDGETGSGVLAVMRHVVGALLPGTSLNDPAELPAHYHRAFAHRRVLVLVDNVRPQPHLELLEPPPGSLLLLTSREPLAFARIDMLTLDPYPRPEARAFFRASGGRLAGEPDKHLDLLAELSGFLPAAMRLNARRFLADPARTIDDHFDELKKADGFRQPLAAARLLSEEPPTPPPPPREADIASLPLFQAAPAPAPPPPEPEPVVESGDPWKLKRAFVQRFQSRSEKDFSLTDLPAPFADPARGPAPDYPNALRFLADYPTTTNGHVPEMGWLESAVSATRALNDRASETRALAMLGKARVKAGEPRLAVACFERWVEFARESGERKAEAEALGWLGVGWTGAGFADRGLGCFDAQFRIAREIGDRGSEVHALGKLGHAKISLGDFENAARLHAEQLALARETGDRVAELDALENLGIAWARLKDHEKAAQFHEEQLKTARAAGDAASECRAVGHLGLVALHLGKSDDAIARYDEQLALASRLGDRTSESQAHASLGVAWARQGDLRKAVGHYEQQLQIARQLGNRLGEASAHSNIGSGLERLGDLAGAASAWEQALAIYEALGSPSADSMRRWLERVRKTLVT